MPTQTNEVNTASPTSSDANKSPTVIAAFARTVAAHPFDTFAKWSQMQKGDVKLSQLLQTLAGNALKQKGLTSKIAAFYPGFPVAVFYKGTQLWLFDKLRPWQEEVKHHVESPTLAALTAGSSMAMLQTTVLQPLNVFKTRLQIGTVDYSWHAFRTDMTSGLGATYLRNAAFLGAAALLTPAIESTLVKNKLFGQEDQKDANGFQKDISSIIGGVGGVSASVGFDFLKTRRQAWPANQAKPSLKDMAVSIWEKEGFNAFKKGVIGYSLAEIIGLSTFFAVKRALTDEIKKPDNNNVMPSIKLPSSSHGFFSRVIEEPNNQALTTSTKEMEPENKRPVAGKK